MGNNIGNFSSNYSSPKLTLTMSSTLNDTPLKKRLHSSSPSKYSSPYHTISNSICKDFNLIFANASNPLSPEWDMTFKRLKVMHVNMDPNSEVNSNESDQRGQTEHNQLINANQLPLQPFAANSGVHPEHELNELTQDFHRLKTPFT